MNPDRFDAMVLALNAAPSRRALLRAFGAGLSAAVLATLDAPQDAAAACKRDGNKCQKDDQCCSGKCQGKKRKRKCRADPDARGCTTDDPYATNCPDSNDADHFCWVTVSGKPFCGVATGCFNCASNGDCVNKTGNASARCVLVPPEGVCQLGIPRDCVVFP